MKINRYKQVLLSTVSAMAMTSALAVTDPVPITAEQAFDAVTTGIDPVTGTSFDKGAIVIVDVRTPPEYQFQGTAGRVDSILMKGEVNPFTPDLGKVKLTKEGKALVYTVRGIEKKIQVDQVAKLETSSLAVNIPCATWNQDTKMMDPAPKTFVKGIDDLAANGVQVVITMCNSGGRSTACLAKFVSDDVAAKFKAFYEIDAPGEQYINPKHKIHLAGLGGFQGSVYGGVYNGFSGFPSRPAAMQSVQGWNQGKPNGPSVSWKDSGLPIYIPETSCNLPDMPRTP